jgi:hypothetical protein
MMMMAAWMSYDYLDILRLTLIHECNTYTYT